MCTGYTNTHTHAHTHAHAHTTVPQNVNIAVNHTFSSYNTLKRRLQVETGWPKTITCMTEIQQ